MAFIEGGIDMNSRERVLVALKHKEPDHVPFDLGGTVTSGIHYTAYRNLLNYLGYEDLQEQGIYNF